MEFSQQLTRNHKNSWQLRTNKGKENELLSCNPQCSVQSELQVKLPAFGSVVRYAGALFMNAELVK